MQIKNVLSLFDGMSCGQIALNKLGIKYENYFASEVDKYTITVTQANFPNTVQLGCVMKLQHIDWNENPIDLMIGGSPCQNFSFAGKQKGMVTKDNIEITSLDQYLELKNSGFQFEGQSFLFWEYVRILKECKPKYFLLENVKMVKKWSDLISSILGVEPILINSSLVSAQNRQRLYWTNIPGIEQPKDHEIYLKDIVEDGDPDREKSLSLTTRVHGATADRCVRKSMHQMIKIGNVNPSGNGMNGNVYDIEGKSPTLTTNKGEGPKITGGAIRGRYLVDGKRQDHKMKTAGLTEQRIEPRTDGKTNCLTTVQKDNVVIYRPFEPRQNINVSDNGLIHVGDASDIKGNESIKRVYSIEGKGPTLTTMDGGHREPKIQEYNGIQYRKLTPLECERLQTVPDNYTAHVSNSQRYKMLGNGWTVDVIAHIFSYIPIEQTELIAAE